MSSSNACTELDAEMQRYLDHVRFEKRLATRTAELYRQDLIKLHALCKAASVAPLQVQPHHVRGGWRA